MMAQTGDLIMAGLRRFGGAFGLLALPLLASACVNLGGGKAPVSLIRLTAETTAPAGLASTAKPGEALVVYEPQTDRSLGVMRVPVQVDDTSIAYMTDATWVDRPARLMRELLAETIRASGKRLVFEDDQAEAKGNLRLTGRLTAMGYDARSRSVIVRYDALFQAADGTMMSRRFEAVGKSVLPKGPAVAEALNVAANDVARQVADWVK